jgi:hypothetical protein
LLFIAALSNDEHNIGAVLFPVRRTILRKIVL